MSADPLRVSQAERERERARFPYSFFSPRSFFRPSFRSTSPARVPREIHFDAVARKLSSFEYIGGNGVYSRARISSRGLLSRPAGDDVIYSVLIKRLKHAREASFSRLNAFSLPNSFALVLFCTTRAGIIKWTSRQSKQPWQYSHFFRRQTFLYVSKRLVVLSVMRRSEDLYSIYLDISELVRVFHKSFVDISLLPDWPRAVTRSSQDFSVCTFVILLAGRIPRARCWKKLSFSQTAGNLGNIFVFYFPLSHHLVSLYQYATGSPAYSMCLYITKPWESWISKSIDSFKFNHSVSLYIFYIRKTFNFTLTPIPLHSINWNLFI